jgi:hypothetical protein
LAKSGHKDKNLFYIGHHSPTDSLC